MTAALEGGEWSAARPGRTLPRGKTRYPFYRWLGGPQGQSGRAENLIPTGIRFRTVQLVIPTTLPGPLNVECGEHTFFTPLSEVTFTVPIFTKLVATDSILGHISCTDFCPYRTKNTQKGKIITLRSMAITAPTSTRLINAARHYVKISLPTFTKVGQKYGTYRHILMYTPKKGTTVTDLILTLWPWSWAFTI